MPPLVPISDTRLLACPPDPFSPAALPVTLYLLAGTVLVWVKHRSNMKRLIAGTEAPNLGDGPRREFALRAVHLVALGVWFGGAISTSQVISIGIGLIAIVLLVKWRNRRDTLPDARRTA